MQAAAKTLADELIDWDELLQCMSLVVVPKADKLRRKLVFIRSWPGGPGKRGYQGCPDLSNCRRPSARD
jgi:hypothetical protein